MRKLLTYSPLLLIFLVTACEEPVAWNLQKSESILVVDGMITSEQKEHEVILTWSSPSPNGPFDPVTGAIVAITDFDSTWVLAEKEPGHYLTPANVQALVNKTYFLYINYSGREFTATTRPVPVTLPPPISIVPYGSGDSLFTLAPAESDIPAMKEYYLDWSDVPGYDTLPPEENHAFYRYYSLQNIDANALFKPGEEQITFPRGTRIQRIKYSLTPAYQEYLRAMLSETAWRGSIFDVEPGNPPGNISGGAAGFFTACTVVRDSITW